MSPLSPARRLRTLSFSVVAASALIIGVLAPAASAAPTWVVPSTAVSTPEHGSSITITGTECNLEGGSILLQLFHGAHAVDWVWRTDPNNQPAGLGNGALPGVDGSWTAQYSIETGLPEGVYTMTGQCTTDPVNGSNGFYYSNVLITISAAGQVTTTTAPPTTVANPTTTAAPAAAAAVAAQPALTG